MYRAHPQETPLCCNTPGLRILFLGGIFGVIQYTHQLSPIKRHGRQGFVGKPFSQQYFSYYFLKTQIFLFTDLLICRLTDTGSTPLLYPIGTLAYWLIDQLQKLLLTYNFHIQIGGFF